MGFKKTDQTPQGFLAQNAHHKVTHIIGPLANPKAVMVGSFKDETETKPYHQRRFTKLGARNYQGDNGKKSDAAYWYELIKDSDEHGGFFKDAEDD
jgi:hypothetical protein